MAKKTVADIIEIKQRAEAELLGREGVTAVDVGFKYVGGQRTDEVAIRVSVRKKQPPADPAQAVPKTIEGIATDVIEREFELNDAPYNPLYGGISVGPCRLIGGNYRTGTMGMVVRDNTTNNAVQISNFHVMAGDVDWAPGDQMRQPGAADGGACPSNVDGVLIRAVLNSAIDGAIASISDRAYDASILEIGQVAGTKVAILGMAVRKRGRTTGLTYGTVDAVAMTVTIDYGDGIGNHMLSGQIGIATNYIYNPKFQQAGDSGSMVVDDVNYAVGLLFAGVMATGYGVANPIADVLSDLDVSIISAFSGDMKIRRAVFGAPTAGQGVLHASGSRFAFTSPASPGALRVALDPSWIGKTLKFKLPAFNKFGAGVQQISGLAVYEYTVLAAPSTGAGGGGANSGYTIDPNPCLTQPVGTFNVNVAAIVATFPTVSVSYAARGFTVADPGVDAIQVYYVTIYDPGYVGDAQGVCPSYAETNQSKVGIAGYTYCGSIYVTHDGGAGVIVTLGGWPPEQGFLVNGT